MSDAFVYARAHVSLPEGRSPHFCLADNDELNEVLIAAIAKSSLGIGKTCMLLCHWGMAKSYDEAKKMVDNAMCPK